MRFSLVLIGILLAQTAQEKAPQKPDAPAPPPYVERIQKEFGFMPGGRLEVTAAAPGSIKVVGWQRSSVMMEAEKVIFYLAPDRAKMLSDQYPVSVRWNQTAAAIRTSGPPQAAATMEVNVTLYVPKIKTDLKIQMLQGDFAIGDINGWVEATLAEGSVEARSMSGYFSSTSQKGNVTVEMSGKRWEGHSLTAVTRQGNIELRLPEDYSAAVQLETRDGDLSIDYPEQLVEGESVPLQATSKRSGHSLKATVGSGGAPVNLQTFSGTVRLTAKTVPQ